MHVVIEGLDAAGKATMAGVLARRLDAALFSFPRYDTPIGKAIRRHLKSEILLVQRVGSVTYNGDALFGVTGTLAPEDALAFQCLMLADKSDAASEMRRTLNGGQHVVCDRWIPSSLCYGSADGLDRAWLDRVHASLPQADLNIFLDITPEEALRRRPEARDRYERDRAKQVAVRAEYQKLWASGGDKYVTVDGDGGGSGDGPIFTVAERVWEVVAKRL